MAFFWYPGLSSSRLYRVRTLMHNHTVSQLSRGLREGSYSSAEVTRNYLERIARLDERYNAFISVDETAALAAAEAADPSRCWRCRSRDMRNSQSSGISIGCDGTAHWLS